MIQKCFGGTRLRFSGYLCMIPFSSFSRSCFKDLHLTWPVSALAQPRKDTSLFRPVLLGAGAQPPTPASQSPNPASPWSLATPLWLSRGAGPVRSSLPFRGSWEPREGVVFQPLGQQLSLQIRYSPGAHFLLLHCPNSAFFFPS